jgi:hypothetical protein
MIEKIVLAIVITFSLYWIVQIKPVQRSVAIEIDFPQAPMSELQTEVSTISRI